ncbi:MAG: hypothetical protein AAF357_08230 [Verrucomicrobiota bacterium]
MKKVCLIAYIYKKPDFKQFFDDFADAAESNGYQVSALHLGVEEDETHAYEVTALPLACSWSCVSQFYLRNANEKLPEPLRSVVDFEPQHIRKVGRSGVESILCNFLVYLRNYLQKQKPEFVILGHQFSSQHQVALHACRELGIPVLFNHPGVVPGTMAFEAGGQMAESEILRKRSSYEVIPIEDRDRECARDYLQIYQGGRLTRPGKSSSIDASELNVLKLLKSQGECCVLYAGIADFRTGVQPRSYSESEVHSPWVKSTGHGLKHLIAISEKQNFKIIFKPHPLGPPINRELVKHENVYSIERVPIDVLLKYAACFITICSSSVYEALLHQVPAVLLGRMQAEMLGQVAAVAGVDELSAAVEERINSKVEYQHEEFVEHLALLLQHYYLKSDSAIADLPMADSRDFWEGIDQRVEQAREYFGKVEAEPVGKENATVGFQVRFMAKMMLHFAKGEWRMVRASIASEMKFLFMKSSS